MKRIFTYFQIVTLIFLTQHQELESLHHPYIYIFYRQHFGNNLIFFMCRLIVVLLNKHVWATICKRIT